jgi:hypothetical protein
MPVLFVVYWWIAVPANAVGWRNLPRWLLYPIAYVLYVILRGAFTGVYPYPFIDAGVLGYPHALLNAFAILCGFTVIGVVLLLLLSAKRLWLKAPKQID